MKYKSIWLVVSCLMVLSLVLVSCAPAAAPTTTSPTAPATTPTTAAPITGTSTATPTAGEEKPKYGGTLTITMNADVKGFDNTYFSHQGSGSLATILVNERLTVLDWTMGPAGSNKTNLGVGGWAPEGIFRQTGQLATNWEIPDDQTLIFHIRQGVNFQNKPPTNGRQMTAADVVFSIKYQYLNPKSPLSYLVVSAPGGLKLTDASVDPKDPWAVVVKVQGMAQAFLEDLGVKGVDILPHEAIEQYGDLRDWRNAVGTGPFMLTDYVPGSAFNFVRNPSYWGKNPIGPGKGDQIPYLDGIKALILADKSTLMAAFRTGKIDAMGDLQPGTWGFILNYQDYQDILRTNPQTQSKPAVYNMPGVGIRLTSTDPLAKPLLDQRVRWALSMAINRQSILDNLYSGDGTYYAGFFPPSSPYYQTPEQMVSKLQAAPLSIAPDKAAMVKTMFEYHPDIAKQLLTAAGYPNGFKTVIVTPPAQVDFLSILVADWAKINVTASIDVKEPLVYSSTIDAHNTQAMFYYAPGWISTGAAKFVFLGPGDPKLPFTVSNRTEVSDAALGNLLAQSNAVYGELDKQSPILQQIEAWAMWDAPYILTPAPNIYRFWQPWVKNYYGAFFVSKGGTLAPLYSWIDQDLKKTMVR